ncbi:MAG: hypothetical protein HRU32_07480 [Rhodobacteraceae bacterium]|nr:hypothetical protein [Paracoccaceae bacterium]
MSQAEDLQARVRAAFARIDAAASGLSAAAPSEDLSGALEAERAANAQLEQRVLAIQEKQNALVNALQAEISALKEALGARDEAVKTVRQMNGKLRKANRELRQAAANGLSDPALVNASLETEIENLRALQTADRAEIDELVTAITPFVEEAERA